MKTVSRLLGAAASLLALAGAAHAEVGANEVKQMMAAKGLRLGGEQTAEGGKIRMFLGVETSGWPHVVSLLDVEIDGTPDAVVMMSFVPGAGGVPLQLLNQINEAALTKAFTVKDAAGLSLTTVTIGGADQATLNRAFDFYYQEFGGYRQAMVAIAQSGGRGQGVSVSNDTSLPLVDRIDAGMSRIEVTARDDELTKKLNVNGGHTTLGAYEITDHDLALELAMEASKKFLGQ
ncbi:hypothetical protein [Parvularcula maris]|uniref:DUF1326 domain-containing protein n=1 Tax=Parvularcula maris TaxID=2965077 RepID=A0A9X2LA51_9PROT|nr:hypothetical protein [Parvularcula maris]MCQ8185786.1 hypothetical protein [Parvularcula maris]